MLLTSLARALDDSVLTESRALEKNLVMEWIARGDIYEEKKHHNEIGRAHV